MTERDPEGTDDGATRQRVTGIGGIFWKAVDPAALQAWYVERLGLRLDEGGAIVVPWRQLDGSPGSTVVAPFPADTTYFAPAEVPYMLNLRVADLDAMLEQLRREGVTVVDGVQVMEFGRFGWILDPEGNKIELWEPAEGI
jgi:catechol 2,3-dioxygenase-like lactoylglutathione lyase family enzyme